MYKVLITTHFAYASRSGVGASVHTVVTEFSAPGEALCAVDIINEQPDGEFLNQVAVPLFAYVRTPPDSKPKFPNLI